ncbi:MAG: hypothetical protein M0R80_25990 [Proteobacteria bacterium]|jgi:hypothetical protein|nr:hypothetical protein [Pseudomonadota bacterium]
MTSAKAKLSLFAVAAVLAAGCGAASNLTPGAGFKVGKSSSVVVMGVSPSMKIRAFQGWGEGKEWQQNELAKAVINVNPENGYVVVPLAPTFEGESYGIMRIVPSVTTVLSVCTGGSAAVFELPAASVVYIGDFHLNTEDGYLVEVGYDYEKALAFMKATYPQSTEPLAKGRVRVAEVTNGQCDGEPVSFVAK